MNKKLIWIRAPAVVLVAVAATWKLTALSASKTTAAGG